MIQSRQSVFCIYSVFCILAFLVQITSASAAQVRIKDLVNFDGVRGNDLVGYGLVVGLNGTGDGIRNSPFTELSRADEIDLPVEISLWVLFRPMLMVLRVCSAARLLELVRMLDIFIPLDERQLLMPDCVKPPIRAVVSSF